MGYMSVGLEECAQLPIYMEPNKGPFLGFTGHVGKTTCQTRNKMKHLNKTLPQRANRKALPLRTYFLTRNTTKSQYGYE